MRFHVPESHPITLDMRRTIGKSALQAKSRFLTFCYHFLFFTTGIKMVKKQLIIFEYDAICCAAKIPRKSGKKRPGDHPTRYPANLCTQETDRDANRISRRPYTKDYAVPVDGPQPAKR